MTMVNIHCESENQRILPNPSRIGIHILLFLVQIPLRSNICNLHVVNSNPTQLCNVNTVFLKSLVIADELETECTELTFDLSFYPKTKQVRWNGAIYMQRTVVKLGESIYAFLSDRKHFENSGLADVLLGAGTVAQGSLPGIMKDEHYNRSVRVIRIMAKALKRKLLSTFIET